MSLYEGKRVGALGDGLLGDVGLLFNKRSTGTGNQYWYRYEPE
jgi:hypothetical protein